MTLRTVEDLRSHVQLATKVELSTIPPYLYAMYSIKDQRSDAARLIASVVVEEMLHVSLTTNLLLALGGEPDFGQASVPVYPCSLAHHKPELPLALRRCTVDLIRDTFMVIERPRAAGAPPEDDDYETLGQFYAALEGSLEHMDATLDLFSNHQPKRQLASPAYYSPVAFDAEDSGGLMLIDDLSSACEALEIIVDQGEGVAEHRWADPGHLELTHYYKFQQIGDGTTEIGPVWPVLDNPRTADLPPRLRGASDLFNACYRLLFITLEQLFSGEDQDSTIGRLYRLMSECLAPTARYLVGQPVDTDRSAGPTFEYYDLGANPWRASAEMAASICGSHPKLTDVADSVLAMTPDR